MGLAIAAMGTAALVVFKKMVKQYVEVGDMIHKMALRTGFSAEKLSELAYAADISGADISMLEKGIKKMATSIGEANLGLKTYTDAFALIGIEVKELQGLNPEEQFMKMAEGIAAIEDPTQRAYAAQKLLGRAGTMLLPLFAEGAEGMKRLGEEGHTLGIIFDKEAAAKAAKLADAQRALKGSVQGLSIAVLNDLIPVITGVTKKFTTWFVENREYAGTWAKSLLGAFQFIAKGIEGLLLAWHGLKTGVFSVAQDITKGITRIAEALLWIAKLTPGTEIFYAEKLRDLIRDLTFASEHFREEKEKGIDTMTNIIVKYEAFVATLNKVKTGIDAVTTAQKSFGTVLVDSSLPATRDMSGVLEAALPGMESYVFANKAMTESQEEFSGLMIGALVTMEASLKGFVDAILGTFEKWAIGQIIPKIMAALPFPINLLATGAAIGAIKAIFAGIRSMEEGGIVEHEGPHYLHAGEVVVPAEVARGAAGMTKAGPGPFHTTVYLSIYAQRLDDRTIEQAAEKIRHAIKRQERRY